MIIHHMYDAAKKTIKEIHHQAFNQELAQGILPKEKFIHYLMQDALYLTDYSKALALTAARLPCQKQAQHFMRFALDAIHAENSLHFTYLNEHRLTPALDLKQSPACFMYTNYLLKMASLAPVEEAVASILPCFWVYREVGKNMAMHKQPNNPYHKWIDLYAGDQFDASVNVAIDITTSLAQAASPLIKEKMIAAFTRATQLEWLFWDSAYRQESWPIEC